VQNLYNIFTNFSAFSEIDIERRTTTSNKEFYELIDIHWQATAAGQRIAPKLYKRHMVHVPHDTNKLA